MLAISGSIVHYITGQRNLLLNWLLGLFIAAIYAALSYGLNAVVWHFGLRIWLARRGDLPLHLVDFLRWASRPELGWIAQIGGAFRFRHRELQEFLVEHDLVVSTDYVAAGHIRPDT
jgi:hypothetical protein